MADRIVKRIMGRSVRGKKTVLRLDCGHEKAVLKSSAPKHETRCIKCEEVVDAKIVGYSFCESINAASGGLWHIRPLTEVGKKLGGGVDTESLCGHVKKRLGWDIKPEISERLLQRFTCKECREKYQERVKKGD